MIAGCAGKTDPLRMHAIPERLTGVIMTRRYTNPPLLIPLLCSKTQNDIMQFVLYCTVLYCIVPSGVIIEAEAGMTVYGQCWGQISSTHCTAPLMYARCVYVWVMCCSWHYSDSTGESVGRAWGCMFTVHSLAARVFYRRPLCPYTSTAPSDP